MNQFSQGASPRFYRLLGTIARSAVVIPELEEVAEEDASENTIQPIDIVFDKIPNTLKSTRLHVGWLRVSDRAALYEMSPGTRLYVPDANTIVLQNDGTCQPEKLSAYIIGCALPAVAYLRDMIPMHVSMVATPKGITMFAGNSGAGKSTTAAAYSRQPNHLLLCDDVAVFENTKDTFTTIHFHSRHIKLWDDAILRINGASNIVMRDSFRDDKYHLNFGFSGSRDFSEIKSLFCLQWGSDFFIDPLRSSACFTTALNSIYAPILAEPFGKLTSCRHLATQLSNSVKAFKLVRNKSTHDVNDSLRAIRAFSDQLDGSINLAKSTVS